MQLRGGCHAFCVTIYSEYYLFITQLKFQYVQLCAPSMYYSSKDTLGNAPLLGTVWCKHYEGSTCQNDYLPDARPATVNVERVMSPQQYLPYIMMHSPVDLGNQATVYSTL
jgi:hypothetical protein